MVGHYILNSSMVISGHAKRLQKKAEKKDREILSTIALQARKNEEILKIIQDADFLEHIDPSDHSYRKLLALNSRIEEHLK